MTGTLPSVEQIAQRMADVRQRIDAVRQPEQQVEILAVTKTFEVELARRAVEAGLTRLGENYAQELGAKAEELRRLAPSMADDVEWHFVGGLQRNKIKLLGATVAVWQTVDRVALVNELAKRVSGATMFVQVNTTDEDQKSGCAPSEAPELVERASEAGLMVRGLMTIGPTDGSSPEPAFDRLRALGDSLGLADLSMGMSGDYETAVRCGATLVRVGSVLFGSRRS